MPTQVIVVGLDCLEPSLCERWLKDMPNFAKLLAHGGSGKLRSIEPPVTVPAWMSMVTGKDPGELGIYGFRNRRTHEYTDLAVASSRDVVFPAIWETLSRQGKRCLVMGVPLTYPVKPLNGKICSCFLATSKDRFWAFPPQFGAEVDRAAGGDYMIDVRDFRSSERGALLETIFEMTQRRFLAFQTLLATERWDFAMMVEMGPDRLHHCFWRYQDPGHRLHEPNSPFRDAIHRYYMFLDSQLGKLMESVGPEANLVVVSDHGCQRLEGAVCINEWLMANGWLHLNTRPDQTTPLKADMIDWSRTKAWGEGGYYARVFLNIRGREPNGIVEPDNCQGALDQLEAGIHTIKDDRGRTLENIVRRPRDIYRDCRNIAPDLMVYFDDLRWRSAGSVGVGGLHLMENDTGPDDANHAWDGFLAAMGPRVSPGQLPHNLLEMRDFLSSLYE